MSLFRNDRCSGTPRIYKTANLARRDLRAHQRKARPERFRRIDEGKHRADHNGVCKHRRDRQQPRFFHPRRQQAADQRCRRADHDVQHRDGGENVGDHAPERQPDRQARLQRHQQAQRVGNAELDVAVGERGRQDGDRGVKSRHDAVQRNLSCVQFFHVFCPFRGTKNGRKAPIPFPSFVLRQDGYELSAPEAL